jgi:hypothetical protein
MRGLSSKNFAPSTRIQFLFSAAQGFCRYDPFFEARIGAAEAHLAVLE